MFSAGKAVVSSAKTYVDDVFSAYTYTGNGGTKAIVNGIDLVGKGGLVWTKSRTVAYDHVLTDTVRGVSKELASDLTAAQVSESAGVGVKAFNSDGYTLGGNGTYYQNDGQDFVSWTFRKAAKFFDVVTYTGNGTTQAINHSLGVAPGMVIIKNCSTASTDWQVWHRSATSGNYLVLNTTAAQTTTSATNKFGNNSTTVDPDSTTFTVGSNSYVNENTKTFVAYLFAHDSDTTNGIIQCGSFTTDGSSNASVTLGWEPQYLMAKKIDNTGPWLLLDVMRGMTANDAVQDLYAQTSGSESSSNWFGPTATGFKSTGHATASNTYIYLAIRRPNKPPTVGTQVYNAIARTGTGAAATVTGVGFPPDLVINANRNVASRWKFFVDRLRGQELYIASNATDQEYTSATFPNGMLKFLQDGMSLGADVNATFNTSGDNNVDYFLKRAPGVFDVVCYTGDGVAGRTISHNLGVVPELIISKNRNLTGTWPTLVKSNSSVLFLSDTSMQDVPNCKYYYGNNTNYVAPTNSNWTVATDNTINGASRTYVAYLFASKDGISKVFTYTGDGGTADSAGTSQTINCGFTTGARFVMIKCTSHTNDWLIWDSTRGIVAGNDGHLSLNTTTAEVTTDDAIDPDNSGFVVNQLALSGGLPTSANLNVTGRTYIGLAFS